MVETDSHRQALVKIAAIEWDVTQEIADLVEQPQSAERDLLMLQKLNGALSRIGDIIVNLDPQIYDDYESV